MKRKTAEDLFDRIDAEISWRKTDLFRLRKLILDNLKPNPQLSKTLLRSAIPLIYSHWEGFVKETASHYFNFISLRKFPFKTLLNGLLSLHIEREYLSNKNNSTYEKALGITKFFQEKLEERSNLKGIPEPIKTRSNLNSDVLKEIIGILELDYEGYRGFEVFIDSKLLESRNKIAHGEYREIDWEFYDEIHNIVLRLITQFKDDIQNSVSLKKYYKSA